MENTYKYQTYLINLDRAKERLAIMESEFSKHGITFERVIAVDAKALDHSSYKVNNKYDRNLVPGEIGCYLSHVKALQTFLASDNDFAVILEDDAIFDPQYKYITEKAMQDYFSSSAYEKWDVLKLYNKKRRHIKVKNLDDKFIIGACGTSVPIMGIAAIWTRVAAQKFISKVCTPLPVITRPIDCDLQHPWEYDLTIYNLLPTIVEISGIETQIQVNRDLRKSSFSLQLKYELNRLFPKYWYLIKQHGFNKFYDSFIAKKNQKIG